MALSTSSSCLDQREGYGYHVTLAFIPWNHWRSRIKNVKMFREYADCFSICAHGCDHTRSEFRSADYEGLLRRNFVAKQRMERHRQRTGLGSEPLMVCPQEQYSLEAMRLSLMSPVSSLEYALMPRNLTARSLLAPTCSSRAGFVFGFPVFKRHYWSGMGAFAMALFLGKPAILVEHHEFFRNGPSAAEIFVSGLAQLRPDLKWTSLVKPLRARTPDDGFPKARGKSVSSRTRFIWNMGWKSRSNIVSFDGFRKRQLSSGAGGGQGGPVRQKNGFLTFETQVHSSTDAVRPSGGSSHKTHQSLFIRTQVPRLSVALRRGL
jgi:hypothetical protein